MRSFSKEMIKLDITNIDDDEADDNDVVDYKRILLKKYSYEKHC